MANKNKKEDKKRAKLVERINELETNLKESLTKKTSNVSEINIGALQSEILRLKKILKEMK
jgi:hypothetical protein